MKTFISITAGVLMLISTASGAEELTGREIVDTQKKRHELPFQTETVQMVLTDKKGRTRERTMQSWAYRQESGLYKVMTKFLDPADVRDVGVLNWEQGDDADDDQWLYMPSAQKVKRIVSGAKKGKFMGTELSYEDLRSENLTVHDYNRIDDATVDGHECYVVEIVPSTAKEKKESGYGKRIAYIRKDIFFIIKTEYFDKKDKHIKTLIIESLENVKGDVWRATRSAITDLSKERTTTLIVQSRDLDTSLTEDMFTKRALQIGQ